jgi:hypothetical protein
MFIAFLQREDGMTTGQAYVGEDRDELLARAFSHREEKERMVAARRHWRVLIGELTEEATEKKQYDFRAIQPVTKDGK